ncbi:MAG: hypothetical protein MZV70_60465 [Desulfobacterales bacterium]|nr:hypothetical protein [Desulfobacterales bacterium]
MFMPLIEVLAAVGRGPHRLVRRRAGAGRDPQPRGAGGLHLLHPHVLPAAAGPGREIQHPAKRHGLGRAHLPRSGHHHRAAAARPAAGRPSAAGRDRGAALRGGRFRLPARASRVLKQVCFAAPPGETVAVVGADRRRQDLAHQPHPPALRPDRPAACCSTAATCADCPSAVFRDRMALVMQDAFLFSGTIRENIFQGAAAADPRRGGGRSSPPPTWTGWSRGCPQGLDTLLGEGGGSISSGERQLIAIARAFARNPAADPLRRGHLLHRLPDRAAGSSRRWSG